MNKFNLAILVLVCLMSPSCNENSRQACEYEKSFVSLISFIKVQKMNNNDSLTYRLFPQLPAISYDTLKSFKQIDSLKAYICKNNLVGLYGVIPLKYTYNADTVFLSAFPISCQCCGDYFTSNRITITLTKDKSMINYATMNIEVREHSAKDSLDKIFRREFDSFFAKQDELSKLKLDTTIRKKYTWGLNHKSRFYITIELQDDNQWNNLELPLNTLLSSYLGSLKESMKMNYGKEICDLTPFEVRLFSSILFLNFDFIEAE